MKTTEAAAVTQLNFQADTTTTVQDQSLRPVCVPLHLLAYKVNANAGLLKIQGTNYSHPSGVQGKREEKAEE